MLKVKKILVFYILCFLFLLVKNDTLFADKELFKSIGTGIIEHIAKSPDERIIACGGRAGSINLYDCNTGKFIRTLQGHRYITSSLIFHPNSKYLISGGDDGIKIWDVQAGSLLDHFGNDTENVTISPDGEKIISSFQGFIHIWDFNSRELIWSERANIYKVNKVIFNQNGTIFITGGVGGDDIKIWNMKTGYIVRSVSNQGIEVTTLDISPNGEKILSGDCNGRIRMWDFATLANLWTIETDDVNLPYIHDIKFHTNGRTFSCSQSKYNSKICIYDLETKEVLSSIDSLNLIYHLISKDGFRYTCFSDREIIQYEINENIILWKHISYFGKINTLSFIPNTTKLVIGTSSIQLIDLESHSKLWESFEKGFSHSVIFSVKSSPDGTLIASGGWNGVLNLWNSFDGSNFYSDQRADEMMYSIAFSPAGKYLAFGSQFNNYIKIFNIEKLLIERSYKFYDCRAIAVSNDGRKLAISNFDKIELVDTESLTKILEFDTDMGALGLTFSLDDSILFSSQGQIFDVKTGQLLTQLEASFYFNGITLSKDGTKIAGFGYHTTSPPDKSRYCINIWDYSDFTLLHQYCGHGDYINSIEFSDDGNILASGSKDGTIRFWNTDFEVSTMDSLKIFRSVTISPNPAVDYVDIHNVMLSGAKHPVVVFDLLGIKYMDSRLRGNDIFVSEEGNVKINVSQLGPGVYFVRIGSYFAKFVKV